METRFHPAADEELWQATDWYDKREPGLGIEFEQDVYDALEFIAASPMAWRQWPNLPEVRVFVMSRFPFLIPYFVDERQLIVLAIAHGKRRPGYWQYRVHEM
ncbi:MAG: type II toxin-antitoxin system RelE/ParE family toxin [Proteobacteria bacterium]|nr:type II toxin-antitoxin system RelE/ParE family toxin [Pseudomonadota bacterium]